MANLSAVTEADVKVIRVGVMRPGPVAETIEAGEVVRYDASTGKWTLANSSSAAEARLGGIAMHRAIVGEGLDVLIEGDIDLGDIFTSMNYGVSVWHGSTDGLLADATTTHAEVVGKVIPKVGDLIGTPGKALHVNFLGPEV